MNHLRHNFKKNEINKSTDFVVIVFINVGYEVEKNEDKKGLNNQFFPQMINDLIKKNSRIFDKNRHARM